MKDFEFVLPWPPYGRGFLRLSGLVGPSVFRNWFARRNRIPNAGDVPQDSQPLNEKENLMSVATSVNNGLNTEALIGARGAFSEAPQAAQFTFRSTCDWIEGTYNVNAIDGYFGLGQEHERAQTFRIESDHPTVFAAADRAPTPPEIVLSALASCLTGGVAAVAQHRGIQLNAVRAIVEGDVDVQGILGMDPEIRNGFSAIRVSFEIDADASREEIAALVAQSQKRSAVFDILTNPTNVAVAVA